MSDFARKCYLSPLTPIWQFAILVATLSNVEASETVLLSNLEQPANDPSPSFISASVWNGAVFITGNEPTRFGSATLVLRGGFPGHFWTTLYSDNGGTPGVPLLGGNLTGPSNPDSGQAKFFAGTDVILAPQTQYWLVASTDEPGTSGQSYGWYMTYSADYFSSAGWQLPNHGAYTVDAGATWISTADALIPRPFFFEITGTVVPEPSTFALLFGGVACFLLFAKRGPKAVEKKRGQSSL